MNVEFENTKGGLKDLGTLQIADYDKEFLLRTDVSKIGMEAVLLQKNQKGEWVSFQQESKKFTPMNVIFISKTVMCAFFWAVKKFEYELRGRKFKIQTGRNVLDKFKNKSDFENDRNNRWVEKIQEFDFTIEYRKSKGMIVTDMLSIIYTQEEKEKKKMIQNSRDKQVEGKVMKHVKEKDS